MKEKYLVINKIICFILVFFLIFCCIINSNIASELKIDGIDKGPSFLSIVPMKKTTFVDYDDESFLDDYIYLSAIPTTVFREKNKLYSNPLLFYQEKLKNNNNPVLDSRMGIHYLSEDWEEACDNEFDEIVAINVDKGKISHLNAKEYKIINEKDPISLANILALYEWSFSDDIVISVIDTSENEDTIETISGVIEKTIPINKIKNLPRITIKRKDYLKPQFEEFDIPEGYTHIKADIWWDALFSKKGAMISTADPFGDPTVQLYFNKNNDWIQTESTSTSYSGPIGHKYSRSYIYEPGSWKIGILDLPTEEIKTQGQPLKSLFSKNVKYNVDISLYPGIQNIKIPDIPKYNTKKAVFKLEWNNKNVNLGFSILGPLGEVIYTNVLDDDSNSKTISFDSLSECNLGENYSICVFTTDDIKKPINFKIKYSWEQINSKNFIDSVTSATEGAVLASMLNSPLLYTSKSNLCDKTIESLYRLGVENIHIVDIGNYASNKVINKLREIGKIKANYKSVDKVYSAIKKQTKQNDIIFTTIDPWTYWNQENLNKAGEKKGSYFFGPAAYLAAHHGSPVFIVENHPELYSSLMYHNEFWNRFSLDRKHHTPSTAEMIITGEKITNFLEKTGFKQDGSSLVITVADQYDIGPTWDRIFPGIANSGRFCGSPVDIANSISRNIFYPILIFENAALKELVELENGSMSIRESNIDGPSLNRLFKVREPLIDININMYKKVRKTAFEEFKNPVLCSFISYQHNFNEKASTYYNTKYTGADGLIPGHDVTNEMIDQNIMVKLNGDKNSIYPDMSESEIIPSYLKKGGYSCAFSTSLDSVVNNLNNGVLLWVHSSHGSTKDGGSSLFWDPEKGFERRDFKAAKTALFHKKIIDLKDTFVGSLLVKLSYNVMVLFRSLEPTASVFEEKNPWRGYEWYYGSTEEPDTMSVDLLGTLPYSNINIPFLSSSSMDWTSSYKPIKTFLNDIIPFKDPFELDDLKDGSVGSIAHSKFQYYRYKAADIEKELENIHSTGFITTMCDTANTYLHLMLIRHGSVFQIQNPLSTSQYGAVWQQSIPRDIILGNTIGEAYTKGLSHVGNLYLGKNNSEKQLWWDNSQNIVCYGDPNLRIYVPNKNHSEKNNWDKEDIDFLNCEDNIIIKGHTPFGAEEYPNENYPSSNIIIYIGIILIISLTVIIFVFYIKRRKNNEK